MCNLRQLSFPIEDFVCFRTIEANSKFVSSTGTFVA
jgi:hypothetical protein